MGLIFLDGSWFVLKPFGLILIQEERLFEML